jgi:hypothetical protein
VTAAPATGRPPVFAAYGEETLSLPPDLARRPGWREWSSGHDVRLWHHATDVQKPFCIFARQDEASIGFHFGTHAAASERHRIMFRMADPEDRSSQGLMLAALVRTARPLRLRDRHCWDMDQVTSDLMELGLIDVETEDEILGSADTQAIFAAIERGGYDAVLYANETEGCHDGRQDSIMVWRAAQIRSVHARSFEIDDPRLCPSLSPTPEEWQWWEENERGIDQWLRHFGEVPARGRCLPA